MLNMMRNKLKWGALLGVLAALMIAGSGAASAANVTVDLCATTGTITMPAMPSAISVSVLGYATGVCSATAVVSAPGGPVIDVNVGDFVTVNLQNKLSAATGLVFQGQSMVPDTTGAVAAGAAYGTKTYTFTASSPGTFLYEAALLPNAQYQAAMGLHGALIVRPAAITFTGIAVARTDATALITVGSDIINDAAVLSTDIGSAVSGIGIPPGTTIVTATAGSSFTISAAATANGIGVVITRTDGTATVTSGSNAVVDAAILSTDVGSAVSGTGIPSGTTITAATANTSFTMSTSATLAPTAYGASTVANDEAVLVLSEIDPALNNSANPSAFDLRNYAPKYFLINGKAYPDTAAITSAAGNKVLFRYVNAGILHHSMGVLGLRQVFVAKDGSLLPTMNHNVVAESLAPGQTGDAIATIPAVVSESKFAVYDASLSIHNSNTAGMGGMLTFVVAGTGAAPTGPTTTGVALTPNVTNGSADVILTATIPGATAAEYFIDTVGANGTGLPIIPATSPNATISIAALALLSSGNHTIYVHGTDGTNWGPVNSAVLKLDKVGPLTSGLTLTPNPSNGAVSVALSATANDSTTGNSIIVAGEYTIDGGSAVAMNVNVAASIAALAATIPSGLATGDHIVSVRSQDAILNWGAPVSITLTVAGSAFGPIVTAVSASPNPNNGTFPLNSTTAVVRVSASIGSAAFVAGAEGFIDSSPANTVRGFPLVASDGAWGGSTEVGYADVPIANITPLALGVHTINVRGKDAAGNWGAFVQLAFLIERTLPTVSGAVVSPVASNNAPVTISATVTDVACAQAICFAGSGEYYIDTVGAAGTGAPMLLVGTPALSGTVRGAIPTTSLSPLTVGNHTIYVRGRDAAGNWSTGTTSTTLLIDRTAPTFTSITLSPSSIPVGTASIGLTVNGATDPLVGGLRSGVAGGEWWIGTTNITAGTGTAFTGATATIPTASLTACSYTVRTRIQDLATNWSTGNNGVRTATLTVTGTPANAIFSDGFEAGNTNAWTSRSTTNTTRLNTSSTAALVGIVGLQAQGNNTNYVQYDFGACPPAAPTFDARFYFNPNGFTPNTGNGGALIQDVFVARTTTGGTVFRVRYQKPTTGANAGQAQVQIQVGTATTNAAWTTINGTGSNSIEVVWQAVGSGGPAPGTLALYVGGVLSQSLTTTSTSAVGGVRLGSVTDAGNNGNTGFEYFDGFVSKRSVSPLIGL